MYALVPVQLVLESMMKSISYKLDIQFGSTRDRLPTVYQTNRCEENQIIIENLAIDTI